MIYSQVYTIHWYTAYIGYHVGRWTLDGIAGLQRRLLLMGS